MSRPCISLRLQTKFNEQVNYQYIGKFKYSAMYIHVFIVDTVSPECIYIGKSGGPQVESQQSSGIN